MSQTGDYELDKAVFNWDGLTWLLCLKMEDTKKKRLTNYRDWYGCKYCDKIIKPESWFVHKEDCVTRGIFRFKSALHFNQSFHQKFGTVI